MKEILRLMAERKLTLNEISSKLELRQSDLLNRLELMEHMGYIKSMSDGKCMASSSPSCACCPISNSDKCYIDKSTQTKITAYKITKKGKRIIQK